eukprot:549347-Amphidinium_carterae.1
MHACPWCKCAPIQAKQQGSARSAETSGRRELQAPAGGSCCGRMTWSSAWGGGNAGQVASKQAAHKTKTMADVAKAKGRPIIY